MNKCTTLAINGIPFLSVSPNLSNPSIVKNINLALVSGGSLVALEGNGSVGDVGFDNVDSSRDLHGLGDLSLRQGILFRFSSLSSRNRDELFTKNI